MAGLYQRFERVATFRATKIERSEYQKCIKYVFYENENKRQSKCLQKN